MKSCPDCTATFPDDYAICPKDGSPLHDVTLWQIGTVIRGKYRILARLGEGGMATVYKAHHELLDEFRALKVIKAELAHDPEFMGRFKNEAIMARRLTHPNAVRVDDLDIAEDGLPFIAMELVVGDTLKALIQRSGALPVSLVLDVSWHVCDALEAAHQLGLVHRDIKPENIVLIAQDSGAPLAKILDFGISRLREQTAGAKGLTQTGMVIGTPEYMSPEQARGKRGNDIDGRSDLYSLGVVMYRMLTGELPFQAETTVEMILHHLKTKPRPPHELRPELAIPEAVSAIVMKALEKDPKRRFSGGAEMCVAIKKARGSTTLASRKVNWESVSTTPAQGLSDTGVRPVVMPTGAETLPSGTGAAVAPLGSKLAYRASARIQPPGKEFPMRLVAALVFVVVLAAGALLGEKYYQSGRASPPAAPSALADGPAKADAERLAVEKLGEESKTGAVVTTTPLPPPPHLGKPRTKFLSFPEKARINELNGLAEEYLKQGGCERAIPTYQQVLDIDPGDLRAYKGYLSCYLKAKKDLPHPAPSTP